MIATTTPAWIDWPTSEGLWACWHPDLDLDETLCGCAATFERFYGPGCDGDDRLLVLLFGSECHIVAGEGWLFRELRCEPLPAPPLRKTANT